MVRILSWNVNGLRALLGKKHLQEFLATLKADIVCVQETKTTRDQLDCSAATADGYNNYFSFCRGKTGYSGVATFCRQECIPVAAEEGLTGVLKGSTDAICCYPIQNDVSNEHLQEVDAEGRAVLTEHILQDGRNLVLVNVYCPRADCDNVERLEYKLAFYDALQQRCQSLQQAGKLVVVVGDLNCCYGKIDSAYKEEEKTESGSEDGPSRTWLKSFVLAEGETEGVKYKLVDTYRHLHPNTRQAYSCWSTLTSARSTNYGTRIDYVLIGQELVPFLVDACVMSDVLGSDHCPVYAELCVDLVPAGKPPSLCSSYWPECAGKQKKLSACFIASSATQGKRSLEEKSWDKPVNKRAKLTSKPDKGKKPVTQGAGKQQTLSSFFTAPKQTDNTQVLTEEIPELTNSTNELTNKRELYVPPLVSSSKGLSKEWKQLLKGPQKPPLCEGHKEPCVRRKVKKDGPNFGKEFFVCARPAGSKDNVAARCDHFQWADKR